MEKMNIRQAILHLNNAFGFEREPVNSQDIVELAISFIQQAIIEFTEDEIAEIIVAIEKKEGLRIIDSWEKDLLEDE